MPPGSHWPGPWQGLGGSSQAMVSVTTQLPASLHSPAVAQGSSGWQVEPGEHAGAEVSSALAPSLEGTGPSSVAVELASSTGTQLPARSGPASAP